MFEHLRRSWQGLFDGTLPPDERREVVARMKETLVHARMGVSAMRDGLGVVRVRLEQERQELATCSRRKQLALEIADAETVSVAERFERYHEERCTVLQRKCDAQEAELALAEREVAEMTVELKYALSGARPPDATAASDAGTPAGAGRGAPKAPERSSAEMDAELKLAALKRRMGK